MHEKEETTTKEVLDKPQEAIVKKVLDTTATLPKDAIPEKPAEKKEEAYAFNSKDQRFTDTELRLLKDITQELATARKGRKSPVSLNVWLRERKYSDSFIKAASKATAP